MSKWPNQKPIKDSEIWRTILDSWRPVTLTQDDIESEKNARRESRINDDREGFENT